MAISAVHYQLLKEHAHLLKRGGSLLEIGEANWYGDMNPLEAMDGFDLTSVSGQNLLAQFDPTNLTANSFTAAKAVYRLLFCPSIIEAVDINGTPSAYRQDLNGPLALPRVYDTIINHGTAEHVFNIAQVFRSMHDWCKTGGIMIHESPFTGWVDHGFYCLQPTLFYDVADANNYELISLSIAHIESRAIVHIESREEFHSLAKHETWNALLFVVLRKTSTNSFRVPMQGIYDGKLSKSGREAWQSAR